MVMKTTGAGVETLDWRAIMVVLAAAGLGAGGGGFLERQAAPLPATKVDLELGLYRLEARIRADIPPRATRDRILAIEDWIRRKDPEFHPPSAYFADPAQ